MAQIAAPVEDGSPPADAETELAYSTVELGTSFPIRHLENGSPIRLIPIIPTSRNQRSLRGRNQRLFQPTEPFLGG
jgi:hypothetical protein